MEVVIIPSASALNMFRFLISWNSLSSTPATRPIRSVGIFFSASLSNIPIVAPHPVPPWRCASTIMSVASSPPRRLKLSSNNPAVAFISKNLYPFLASRPIPLWEIHKISRLSISGILTSSSPLLNTACAFIP